MTINLNSLRQTLFNVAWFMLLLGVMIWEKAWGWPVLSLWGLVVTLTAVKSSAATVLAVGLWSLVLAGLFDLPLIVIIIWVIITFWLVKKSQRGWVSYLMAWLGAVAVNLLRPIPVDGVVVIYLVSVALISIFISVKFRPKWSHSDSMV